jgi:hypothetical protein
MVLLPSKVLIALLCRQQQRLQQRQQCMQHLFQLCWCTACPIAPQQQARHTATQLITHFQQPHQQQHLLLSSSSSSRVTPPGPAYSTGSRTPVAARQQQQQQQQLRLAAHPQPLPAAVRCCWRCCWLLPSSGGWPGLCCRSCLQHSRPSRVSGDTWGQGLHICCCSRQRVVPPVLFQVYIGVHAAWLPVLCWGRAARH